jgi:hypothetical protein
MSDQDHPTSHLRTGVHSIQENDSFFMGFHCRDVSLLHHSHYAESWNLYANRLVLGTRYQRDMLERAYHFHHGYSHERDFGSRGLGSACTAFMVVANASQEETQNRGTVGSWWGRHCYKCRAVGFDCWSSGS